MYEQSITREHRTAFVIAVDQSGSMNGEIKYQNRVVSKAVIVAEVINNLIQEIIERARRHDGIRDYYDVAILGYSGEGITYLIGDESEPFTPITDLAATKPATEEIEISTTLPNGDIAILKQRINCWISPKASGATPMFETLYVIRTLVSQWCLRKENYMSFPPIIFNITDGESSDSDENDVIDICNEIKHISTNDGAVLMVNIHIASSASSKSVIFPAGDEQATPEDRRYRMLYSSASTLPTLFNEAVGEVTGITTIGKQIKAMAYNASISELIAILNIGSISVKRG